MKIIGKGIMCRSAAAHAPEALARFSYPRSYTSSADRLQLSILSAVLLLVPYFVSDDRYWRLFFTGFVVLVDMAYLTYAFGSKITLYADRIECQSCFFFKRVLPRNQIISWQLQLTYVKNSPIFSLALITGGKDLVFELTFDMDAAFYAWFPDLQTLIQDSRTQFPGLQRLSQ